MTNLFFFHTTDDYIETFDPQYSPMNKDGNPSSRPLFYWFSNVYFKYLGDKYLYLFIVNPKKENIAVRHRLNNEEMFDGIWRRFKSFSNNRLSEGFWKEHHGVLCPQDEPPIIMSFNILKPTLILKKVSENTFSYQDKIFKFADEQNQPIPFDKTELVKILPELKNSLPFVEPRQENVKFIYEDWLEMKSEKNGTWL